MCVQTNGQPHFGCSESVCSLSPCYKAEYTVVQELQTHLFLYIKSMSQPRPHLNVIEGHIHVRTNSNNAWQSLWRNMFTQFWSNFQNHRKVNIVVNRGTCHKCLKKVCICLNENVIQPKVQAKLFPMSFYHAIACMSLKKSSPGIFKGVYCWPLGPLSVM